MNMKSYENENTGPTTRKHRISPLMTPTTPPPL